MEDKNFGALYAQFCRARTATGFRFKKIRPFDLTTTCWRLYAKFVNSDCLWCSTDYHSWHSTTGPLL